jgi:hypothetical protein
MPAKIHRLLLNATAFAIAGLPVPGLCAPDDREAPPRTNPARIESTVIRPSRKPACEGEDCGVVDRLTAEQLDRLRELDNKYPRKIIEFNSNRRDRTRRRSN